MANSDSLVETWAGAFRSVAVGWDFSSLTGNMDEPDPPWDFDLLSVEALGAAEAALDMGTGGGEQLTRLVDRLGDARPTIRRRHVPDLAGWLARRARDRRLVW